MKLYQIAKVQRRAVLIFLGPIFPRKNLKSLQLGLKKKIKSSAWLQTFTWKAVIIYWIGEPAEAHIQTVFYYSPWGWYFLRGRLTFPPSSLIKFSSGCTFLFAHFRLQRFVFGLEGIHLPVYLSSCRVEILRDLFPSLIKAQHIICK